MIIEIYDEQQAQDITAQLKLHGYDADKWGIVPGSIFEINETTDTPDCFIQLNIEKKDYPQLPIKTDTRFRIHDPHQWQRMQEYLNSQGYTWVSGQEYLPLLETDIETFSDPIHLMIEEYKDSFRICYGKTIKYNKAIPASSVLGYNSSVIESMADELIH